VGEGEHAHGFGIFDFDPARPSDPNFFANRFLVLSVS
jgi:hypothetical protein